MPFGRIEITPEEGPALNESITYNLYQLFTAGAHSPRTNIPAKGLTGEGYEGHTFWDSEIYMVPFFLHADPKLALNLLEYRYYHLEAAREEAYKLGNPEGVKYAWRTISGQETVPIIPPRRRNIISIPTLRMPSFSTTPSLKTTPSWFTKGCPSC